MNDNNSLELLKQVYEMVENCQQLLTALFVIIIVVGFFAICYLFYLLGREVRK